MGKTREELIAALNTWQEGSKKNVRKITINGETESSKPQDPKEGQVMVDSNKPWNPTNVQYKVNKFNTDKKRDRLFNQAKYGQKLLNDYDAWKEDNNKKLGLYQFDNNRNVDKLVEDNFRNLEVPTDINKNTKCKFDITDKPMWKATRGHIYNTNVKVMFEDPALPATDEMTFNSISLEDEKAILCLTVKPNNTTRNTYISTFLTNTYNLGPLYLLIKDSEVGLHKEFLTENAKLHDIYVDTYHQDKELTYKVFLELE